MWKEHRREFRRRMNGLVLCGFFVMSGMTAMSGAGPALSCERSTGDESRRTVHVRHLGADCSAQERERHAVASQDLMPALAEGQGLDLQGVVVTGDVSLDALPIASDEQMRDLPVTVREWFAQQDAREIRIVRGGISIRDSTVRGSVTHRNQQGYLVIAGPVTMTGTVFEGIQDWSRVIFLGPVDWSRALFVREGFFVQDRFWSGATFDRTRFNVQSRFHRTVFQETVSFREATFNGLAELLEVTFRGPTSFSGALFKQGTGFSGSHFQSESDFSRSLFEREAYFMFTVFDQRASFRGTVFRSVNSYADAEFNGTGDFATAMFERAPEFTRTKFNGERLLPSNGPSSWPAYIVVAVALIFTLLILRQAYRSRKAA